MYTDFSCPVRLIQSSATVLPDTSRLFELTLLNASDKQLSSIGALIITETIENERISELPISATGLYVEAGHLFRMSPMLPPNSNYHHYDLIVKSMAFTDGSVWSFTPENLVSVFPRLAPSGAEKDMRVALCGKDAIYTPQVFDRHWICVCGFPNSNSCPVCGSCGRQKKTLFSLLSGEGLEKEYKAQTQKRGGVSTIYPAVEKPEYFDDEVDIDSTPYEIRRGSRLPIILLILAIIAAALFLTRGLWLDKAKEIIGISATETIPPYKSLLTAQTPSPTSEAEAIIQEALNRNETEAPMDTLIPVRTIEAAPTATEYTPAATKAPTEAPTSVPTQEPTKAPTATPTKEPTKAPTATPTKEPTKAPTATPKPTVTPFVL